MRIASLGELLIDFVAMEHGVTVGEASGFYKAPGGAPANVAVAVARLGVESAFLGQVGNDPFGHYLRDVLQAEGVNVSGLRFIDEARTMLAFVSLTDSGERSFSFYRHPSADMLMTPEDVARDVLDAVDILHYGSITMISSPAKEATLAAIQYAQQAGKLLSYDPNLRLNLWPDAESARTGMRAGLNTHIVKISSDELDYLLLEGERLSDLWERFPTLQIIILTYGAEGATLYTRQGDEVQQPGYKMSAVDTTGAGDAFVGGLLVGLVEQGVQRPEHLAQPLDYAAILRRANASGALTTTQRGAIPALPSRAQVDQFLAQQKG